MSRRLLLAPALLLLLAATAPAATITIVNVDDPGEGFNDPTPAAPVGGNPGTTLGEQRLNLFERAAEIWGGLLESDVEIRIQSGFQALSCDASGGVLGAAGALVINRDFPGAEFPNTWYHGALSDKLAGVDLDPGASDIQAVFNSSIDNNDACLSGTNWYYGFDGNAGGDIALLPVLLHEMAHGLGFSTFVDEDTGAEILGRPDIYERFLLDTTTGEYWNEMTDGERVVSAVNDGNLVWDGAEVTAAAPDFLSGPPVMIIDAPAGLGGPLPLGSATFGPRLDETGVSGGLVLADDGSGVATDACSPLVNGAAMAGNIALIDRGSCTFAGKALAAQAAGAIAAVIVDNAPGATPPTLGGAGPDVTIPTVSLTQADGDLLKAALGGGVTVTLRLDPTTLAGADALGRVRIYAPNPTQGGSSISHFDVSAEPSLLMEPAITSLLNDEVDLTLPHFLDIGWTTPALVSADPLPALATALDAAYPNPFNPSTRIAFRLAADGPARLSVHDVAGRLVRTLAAGALPAGEHVVTWSGDDDAGRRMPSGVYFYRLEAAGLAETRKMVLLK